MTKKLSVLKPRRLRNLLFFLSFFYHNYEETVTNFEKDMFRKEPLAVFTLENLDTSLKVSTVIISFYKCKSVRKC